MYYKNKLYFSVDNIEDSKIVVLGLPYDSTASFRPGSRFGPNAIREAICGIETYSPYFNNDIENKNIFDLGDLEIPFGDPVKACNLIKNEITGILKENKKIISFGGEHLVTFPIVKSFYEFYGNDLNIIQLDAHADLRDEYLGCKLSHASVMKLIKNFLPENNMYQFFIRSGLKEEWDELRNSSNNYLPLENKIDIDDIDVSKIKDTRVYLTIDIDVFDPSICSGTGTPEAGGIDINIFIKLLKKLRGLNIVGADIVELAPHYDQTGCSSVLAAKIFRELVVSLF